MFLFAVQPPTESLSIQVKQARWAASLKCKSSRGIQGPEHSAAAVKM